MTEVVPDGGVLGTAGLALDPLVVSRLRERLPTVAERTVEAVTSVQATLHEMLLAIPVLGTNIAHSDRQHAALVRAIGSGNAERARKTMEHHCDDTAALLRGLLV